MSAKDRVRRNKTVIQTTLCGDHRLILTKVFEKYLITEREYNNLKSINKEDVEGHVVELVDTIMNKGEESCQAFLHLLQTDEDVKKTYPELKHIELNVPHQLPLPIQACSNDDRDVLSPESKRPTQHSDLQAGPAGRGSLMDRLKLLHIDDKLDSFEVAALCFLCRDVVSRKCLEKVQDAKDLFLKLEEKGLLENRAFLSQLLRAICRADLLSLLETDSRRPEETDANALLSAYSLMLYEIYQNMTQTNFEKMMFLLKGKLVRRQMESCKTPLDVFAEMERTGLLSNQNLDVLHKVLQQFDHKLARTVKLYMQGLTKPAVPPDFSMDYQTEYYALTHIPRGQCVVINNMLFEGVLGKRTGSEKDEEALRDLFTQLGFTVVVHHNLTADAMQHEVRKLSQRNFVEDDALVIFVLTHGAKGCVYGSDGQEVYIRELTLPFTSERAPTLAGKPKLFFIQACQRGENRGEAVPLPPWPRQAEEPVASNADFLLGMATVQEGRTFRNTAMGSIYIQELCRQLKRSAESSQMDNILSVLTRVNREVSKGVFLNQKQMPEPKYTLTKQLVLKYV